MRGYGQFCPVAVACETFAERWNPLILRELLSGARRFGEFRQGIPLIPRAILAQRLRHLEQAGVVRSERLPSGRGREYHPTPAAEEFREIIDRLGKWGQRWARTQFDHRNLDLTMLLWSMRRRIDARRLPSRRVVVRFEFRGFPPRCRPMRNCWFILERKGVDVCLKDPGADVDLVVDADVEAMARYWTGHLTFQEAVSSGGLRLKGPRELVRAFPGWLLRSRFAQGMPGAGAA
jgi:DNA-binding HxlR family transcriptional regulator